jgi:hypothetical protein
MAATFAAVFLTGACSGSASGTSGTDTAKEAGSESDATSGTSATDTAKEAGTESDATSATLGMPETGTPEGAPADASVADVVEELPPFHDPFGGASGCTMALDAGETVCAADVALSGAVDTVLTSAGSCGAIGSNALDVAGRAGDGIETVLTITFPGDIVPGVVGVVTGAAVKIERPGVDGSIPAWQTPIGACTITIDSNACSPISIFANRYVISGTGTCTQPAAPSQANPLGPITVGNFDFVSFIDPSDQ